jgi:hypothetical protein
MEKVEKDAGFLVTVQRVGAGGGRDGAHCERAKVRRRYERLKPPLQFGDAVEQFERQRGAGQIDAQVTL